MNNISRLIFALVFGAFSANAQADAIVFNGAAVPNSVDGSNNVYGYTLFHNGAGDNSQQDIVRTNLLGQVVVPGGDVEALYTGTATIINYGGDAGRFTPNNPFPGGANEKIAMLVRGYLQIPTTGAYTFGVHSDDGFTLAFDNGASPFTAVAGQGGTNLETYNGFANGAVEFPGGRGMNDSFGVINLTAGIHRVDLTYGEGNGGEGFEFFAASGTHTSFNSNFNLIEGAAVAGVPEVRQDVPRKFRTAGDWTLTEYNTTADGNVNGATRVSDIFASGSTGILTGTTLSVKGGPTTVDTIRYNDPSDANNGSHGGDATNFPSDNPGVNDDNYGAYAQTTLDIVSGDEGRYTILVYSDDASRFRILDSSGTNAIELVGTNTDQFNSDGDANGNDMFGTNGCCNDQIGKYDLAVGTYTLQAAFQEGTGGSGWFIYGAMGDYNGFNEAFQLIGSNISETASIQIVAPIEARPEGLQWAAIPEPSSFTMAAFGMLSLIAIFRKRKIA